MFASRNYAPAARKNGFRSNAVNLRVGYGYQQSHHGELVQGPVVHGGTIHTGLITLPRLDRAAIAKFLPTAGRNIQVRPEKKAKAKRAAREVLDLAGHHEIGGELLLTSNILENGGGGSSTSDIIATIRATSNAIDFQIGDEAIQQLCWQIEGASDPLALMNNGGAIVYGSRCGQVIRHLQNPLPPIICLGFVTDPNEVVLTESLVGREGYTFAEVASFNRIIQLAERGVALRRAELVAKAATESARLNQFRVATRHFADLELHAKEAGALGISASHSGVVAAAIFDPSTPNLLRRVEWLTGCLSDLGCTEIEPFPVNV